MKVKKRGAAALIILFILVLGFLLWNEASAETSFAWGPTVISSELSKGFTLVLEETWQNKYRASLGYVSPQTCQCSNGVIPIKENAYVYLGRVARLGNFEMSIGPLYQVEPNRVTSSRLNFKLGIRWYLGERLAIGLSHVSNAGAAGAKIGSGWNTGQDAPLLILRVSK